VISVSKLISKCPCCNGTLNITSLQCPDCGVELRNTFELSAFDRLDEEQMRFLLSFLRHRGNLKNLQEEINISYPTAKKRLEELLVALEVTQEESGITKQEVLDMRLDKFLKVSRIIKRRTIANEACDQGRVSLNGKVARASADVKPGDLLEIQFGNKVFKAEILNVVEVVKKDDASTLYKTIE
jgi:ribosomal 50S subunit-recycling heat shock protein